MSNTQESNIWKVPGYTATMLAIAAAFGAWSILLPVVPLAVIDSGGSATLAGSSTGIFMAFTVLTQIISPWLLRRWGYRRVMALSAFTLGVPAFGHLLGTDAWVVLLFSAMRGVGFGALTVSESALIAELAPVRLLGKATGMIGVFTGLGQMVFLPLGLIMAEKLGYASTYITAGIIGFLGFGLCLRIPKIKVTLASDTEDKPNLIRVPTWKLVLVPALALTTFSMSYGAVSSFLPPAVQELDAERGASLAGIMLSIVGGAAMIFRYLAGMVADRVGTPGRLYIPSRSWGLWACLLSQCPSTSMAPCGGSCLVPSCSVARSVLPKMRRCCPCLIACRGSGSRRLRPSGISSMTAAPVWARLFWAPWSPAMAMRGRLGPAWPSSWLVCL